jgi:release factor glutamine methyltransferase
MSYNELWHRLTQIYDGGEARAIARMVFELRFGLSMSDICIGKDTQLSADCQAQLEEISQRLLQHEPVQYILGQASFCGHTFHVEPGVLIPRPETEDLCCRIIAASAAYDSATGPHASILDIGTGSGCIAVTLALELQGSEVTAWDISPIALRVAKENAQRLGTHVNVVMNDILKQSTAVAPQWDIIVSNPPYICNSEAQQMEPNVLDYEPAAALFVPDDDPLLFYRPIMDYALSALYPGGTLWLETNPLYLSHIKNRLSALGFSTVMIMYDPYDKPRFIKAKR